MAKWFNLLSWFQPFFLFSRRIYKYALHCFTGKCEIERIYESFIDKDNRPNGSSSLMFFTSFMYSQQLRDLISFLIPNEIYKKMDRVELLDYDITKEDKEDMEAHRLTLQILARKSLTVKASMPNSSLKTFILHTVRSLYCFMYIRRCLLHKDNLRFPFDNYSVTHLALLKKLWSQLLPEYTFERISPHWSEMGFQGKDPVSDLRAMGLLGIQSLVYFCDRYPHVAKKIMLLSQSPDNKWFSFAVTFFNLGWMILEFFNYYGVNVLKVGILHGVVNIDLYYQMTSIAFVRFNALWTALEPTSVMEFPSIRDKFKILVVDELLNNKFSLSNSLLVSR